MGLMDKIFGTYSERELKRIYPIRDKVLALDEQYSKMSDQELKAMTPKFKERLANGETLDDILPEAFATCREAAWRVLGMKHFPVQVIGGIVLHQGRIAEMKTGEGKTLVATLPVYLNALTGKGVHVVTVNDYLAKRDSEEMGKVYRWLGLTVGLVIHDIEPADRKKAYQADITYGTNNEFGFDYLRDNMQIYKENRVQRGHYFAVVDEVDSILIDEARTPLIISGRGDKSTDLYKVADRFARTLKMYKVKELDDKEEHDDVIDADYIVDEKAKTATLTKSGVKKAEEFFGLENLMDMENSTIQHHINQAIKAHGTMHRDINYVVKDNEVLIVDEFTGRIMNGRRYSEGLHQAIEAKEGVEVKRESKTLATITYQNLFRMYEKLSGMTGTAMTEEQEFREIYGMDVIEIPTNKPVIRTDLPDVVYKTRRGKFNAVVEQVKECHAKGQPVLVGTVSIETSEELSALLKRHGIKHQVLNAKYHEKEAEIVAQAGQYGAVTIATNMAGRGTDIMLGGNAEFLAKNQMRKEGYYENLIVEATGFGDTDDEEVIEARKRFTELSKQFKEQLRPEAEKVKEAGGLFIVGTERHESRRIDNQLRGRSGRQGDPGESIFFISLEDDLIKRFGGDRMKKIYSVFCKDEDTCLQSKMLSRGIENAQRAIEGRNFGIRKTVLQYDDVMNKQREVMYAERMKVLKGEDVHEQVVKYIPDFVRKVVSEAVNIDEMPEKWDADALNRALENRLLPEGSHFITPEKLAKWDVDFAIDKITKATEKAYEEKIKEVKEELGIDYADVERRFLLMNVDRNWIDQIDAMDQLRKGIGLRAYGNVDPVISYKQEGFEMFDEMVERIQSTTIAMLLKVRIEVSRPMVKPIDEPKPAVDTAELTTNSSESSGPARPVSRAQKTPGRNDPCPCGSGKKYKNCCGKNS